MLGGIIIIVTTVSMANESRSIGDIPAGAHGDASEIFKTLISKFIVTFLANEQLFQLLAKALDFPPG